MNSGGYPELKLAESPGFDPDHFLTYWLPDDPWQPDPQTPGYYGVKARIAATIKPAKVVEIGVRAGYSAIAFYLGHPYREFYGLDMDEGGWGGVAGYLARAAEQLHPLPNLHYTLEKGDSQQMKQLPPAGRNADLFHVDANHTPKGTAHDILVGLFNGAKHIVVDDYDSTEYVAEGADWVIRFANLDAWYVGDGGYRGSLVLARKGSHQWQESR